MNYTVVMQVVGGRLGPRIMENSVFEGSTSYYMENHVRRTQRVISTLPFPSLSICGSPFVFLLPKIPSMLLKGKRTSGPLGVAWEEAVQGETTTPPLHKTSYFLTFVPLAAILQLELPLQL